MATPINKQAARRFENKWVVVYYDHQLASDGIRNRGWRAPLRRAARRLCDRRHTHAEAGSLAAARANFDRVTKKTCESVHDSQTKSKAAAVFVLWSYEPNKLAEDRSLL